MANNKQDKILNVPNKREQRQTCLNVAERQALRPKGSVPNKREQQQTRLNVPALRFPEFKGQWETATINNVAKVVGGGTPDTSNKSYWDGTILWFTPSEIGRDKYVESSLRKITTDGLNNSSAKILPIHTILLSSRATVGECSIALKECTTNQGFQSLIAKNCDFEFLYYLIQTKKKDLIKKACGSTFSEISANEVRKIQIDIPLEKEQVKIGQFLSLLDARIATQRKIIEDLEQLKKAISSLIFRDTSVPIIQLYTFMKKGKAGGTPTSTNKDYYGGDIPFLSINDITEQGKYINHTEKSLTSKGIENSSAWVVPQGSLIFSMYASVGLVTINTISLATSQAMFAMVLKDPLLTDYLYYFLTYFRHRYIYKYLETGTQSNINAEIVRTIPIPDFGVDHNIAIGKILSSIDKKISIEKKISQLLLKQKKYLLHNLFI